MLFPSICHSGKVKSITSSRALFDPRCHEQPLMNLIPSWCHEFSICDIRLYYISNSLTVYSVCVYINIHRCTYIITYVYLFSFVSWRIPLNLHPGATAPVRVIALHSIKGATLLLLSLTTSTRGNSKRMSQKKWVTKNP